MRSAVAEKTAIYCARALNRRGGTRSKTQTVIHAAECFWPYTVFMYVESVQKIETRLECGQLLPRKVQNTVLMLASCQAAARTQSFAVFSATADRIRVPFHSFGPIQHS
jgi:hypothetical protein